MFVRGQINMMLTTENEPGPGGEALVTLPLVWIGANGGTAWKNKPVPVAFCTKCIFRAGVLKRLDDAGMEWDMIVDSEIDNAVEAVLSADLAVYAAIKGVYPRSTGPIAHDGALPDPGKTQIVLYMQDKDDPVQAALRLVIRQSYLSEWSHEDARLRA